MQKLIQVAIIGFPNVGKSTLFNRLLGKKKSLVHSLPGMTRDKVTSRCRLQGKEFNLVDTGGFLDQKDDPLSQKVKQKAWEAAQESDILLFVFDGKRELLPAEEELFFSLKKLGKKVLPIINKIDSPSDEEKLGDFYRLGVERIYPISAEHKRNLKALEGAIEELIPETFSEEEEAKPLRIAIVGRINVGKSSLVNRLCGKENLIVSEIPGTTRDSIDTLLLRERKAYILIDTAGLRKLSRTRDKREKASIIKAKKDIMTADVVCLVMDCREFPTRQDASIARLAHQAGKPLVIALNKLDLIQDAPGLSRSLKERMYPRLDFVRYAPIVSVSAVTGKRVVKILDLAEEVYRNASKKIKTSALNEFLKRVKEKHPPFSRKRERMKLKYMTQASICPPTFLLFTSSPDSLLPSYEKLFVNLLRREFGLAGTPIRLILKKK